MSETLATLLEAAWFSPGIYNGRGDPWVLMAEFLTARGVRVGDEGLREEIERLCISWQTTVPVDILRAAIGRCPQCHTTSPDHRPDCTRALAATPPGTDLLDTSYHRRRVARRRATPTPPDVDTLANALYVACVQPELTWWDDLPPDAQEAWRRAAKTALEFR